MASSAFTASTDMPASTGAGAGGLKIDQTTVLSLLSTLAILFTAHALSRRLLPLTASSRTRVLFTWHAFDALIHTVLEGSFLYHCFTSKLPVSKAELLASTVDAVSGAAATVPLVTAPGVHFLADAAHRYGPAFGSGPMAALWREYAKADARWGAADLGVISLEILTVGIGAPLAAWCCYMLVREGDIWAGLGVGNGGRRRVGPRAGFWMAVLAVGELYGGFMTFAPEWLTGSPNLDTSNWMYLWVYLVFFNMLWVALPLYVLYVVYDSGIAADAESSALKRDLRSR